jgi:hypothetical protein
MYSILTIGIILILMSLFLVKLFLQKRKVYLCILFIFFLFLGLSIGFIGYNINGYEFFNRQKIDKPLFYIRCEEKRQRFMMQCLSYKN